MAQLGSIGFAVFLSLKEQAAGFDQKVGETLGHNDKPVVLCILRLGKVLGIFSVVGFYLFLFLRYRLDLYYFYIFLSPASVY